MDDEHLARGRHALEYHHTKTRDLSLGQNPLQLAEQYRFDRATMRSKMREKLAGRLSKLKDPRNLKCSMDRDVDFRKKREE